MNREYIPDARERHLVLHYDSSVFSLVFPPYLMAKLEILQVVQPCDCHNATKCKVGDHKSAGKTGLASTDFLAYYQSPHWYI